MSILENIAEALKTGRAPDVSKLVNQALSDNISAESILNDGLIAGMNTVGILFKSGKIYVPQVLIAARAMYAGLDILNPLL